MTRFRERRSGVRVEAQEISGRKTLSRLLRRSHTGVRQDRALSHRHIGAPTLAATAIVQAMQCRRAAPESFGISADGHYVGKDGFIVPKDFRELFERDPLQVRRWLTRRASRRFDQETLRDLEQDLLLYLCTLPTHSRFREKGAGGRPDGCVDIIQCFDPVRHFGASAGRFYNFIHLCLANRLSTILSKRRLDPLCDPRILSITNCHQFQENKGSMESGCEIDEAYLLSHSSAFARAFRRRAGADDLVVKMFVQEFKQFAEQEDPKVLVVVRSMESCGTLRDAERSSGLANREFRRCCRNLSRLKNRFLERKRSPPKPAPVSSHSLERPMPETSKVFLREELYERVWTTPMHRLAKEFGYSDVGLAKLCEKHNIPRPGLGHWRRVELGQKPGRTPLPVVEQPSPYRIEVAIRERPAGQSKPEKGEVLVIPVLQDSPISHPLVVRLERLLRNAKKSEKGLLVPRTGTSPHLLVTEETYLRALQILNSLFAGFEQHGVQIAWPKEESAHLSLAHESETIGFCLSEILETKPHTLTKEETDHKKRYGWCSSPKWDYQSTGSLKVSLVCNESTSTRKTWSDGKKHRLEDWLGEVIAGVGALARAIKGVKAERQRWHEEFEAKQKRRREEEEREREFARRGEVISKAAQALHQSQLVRRLAVCLGNSVHLSKLDNQSLTDMRELLEWCSEYANSIDPTCEPEVLLSNFHKKASRFLGP